MLSFKPAFSFFSFTFIKRLFNSLSAIRVVSSPYYIMGVNTHLLGQRTFLKILDYVMTHKRDTDVCAPK